MLSWLTLPLCAFIFTTRGFADDGAQSSAPDDQLGYPISEPSYAEPSYGRFPSSLIHTSSVDPYPHPSAPPSDPFSPITGQDKAGSHSQTPAPNAASAGISSTVSPTAAISTIPSHQSLSSGQLQASTSASQDAFSLGISSGSVNASNPDPCGPPLQASIAAANSSSTCHANVSVADVTTAQYYGVQCQHSAEQVPIQPDTCYESAQEICNFISSAKLGYQVTNQWIWSTLSQDCTFGYWLPQGGAPPPDSSRCYEQIMMPMYDACKWPTYNLGSINLKELPSINTTTGQNSTGVAVRAEYPSYILVPVSSFLGVNSEDWQASRAGVQSGGGSQNGGNPNLTPSEAEQLVKSALAG